jgi:DHA2 family methylenomycin A resistance protein-like MFS transporter
MATGAATLLFANASTPYGALVAQLIVVGFGLGLIVPVMTAALLGSVDRSHSGVAAGALNTARQTGSVIGVALFGALAAGSRGIVGGLHAALAISVVLALVVVVLSARIGCRVNRRRPAVAPSRVPTRQAADTRARP